MMDAEIEGLVDQVLYEARKGATQDYETIVRLLSIDPVSEEGEYLQEQARLFGMEVSDGVAGIAGAIGVDLAPCKMNCGFCSFGEDWGLVTEPRTLSIDEVLELARDYVENGVTKVTLRTTEFFPISTLCSWIKRIRREIPGNYELNLNVGELTPQAAQACYQAGASSAYHVCRMGEGVDTPFDPEVRKRSIRVIAESPLKLGTCIEPIGPEHTNEEIAEKMSFVLSMHPDSTGVMPRIPVPGTPLGDTPMLSRERLRHIAAVLRLAAGSNILCVTMHPDDEFGLEAGTNGFSVERGAIPRDVNHSKKEWKGLTAAHAVEILKRSGYRPGILNPDPRFVEGAHWWHPDACFEDEEASFLDEDGRGYIERDGSIVSLAHD